jgi:hypothetical protein
LNLEIDAGDCVCLAICLKQATDLDGVPYFMIHISRVHIATLLAGRVAP